jgi:hypothetical protein
MAPISLASEGRPVGRSAALSVPRLLLLVLACAIVAAPVAAQRGPVLPVPPPIDGTPVFGALAPDAIRAIDAPTFLSGEAAARQMTADEPVLGLRLAGEARAYPLGYLSAHEIVNDRLGDAAIAVTW